MEELERRIDQLWHALACALCVPEPTNEREEQMLAFARNALGVGPKAAHQAAMVALTKYAAPDEWGINQTQIPEASEIKKQNQSLTK